MELNWKLNSVKIQPNIERQPTFFYEGVNMELESWNWIGIELRNGIKSYDKFVIFTRQKIDLETPPFPPSLVQFFQSPAFVTVKQKAMHTQV